MAARSGRAARIAVTSAAVSSTNEAATLSTDGKTLTITSTGRRHWDRGSTLPSVFVSGSTGTVNTDDKTVNHVQGIVTFSTPHSTTATYTLDVSYLPASFIGLGKAWTLDTTVDVQDVTAFSTTTTDPTWRTRIAGLSGASASIDRFRVADSTANAFFDRFNTGSSFVVELWTNSTTNHRFEAFARLDGDSYTVPNDGTAEETVSLTVDGAVYSSTN